MRLTFIIGCARSGTSILGELLAQHPGVNYQGEQNQHLWHKWHQYDHHRLTVKDETPIIRRALRDRFSNLDGLVVDKCPPNSLRIPFLATVFPEAKFIHIVRDGRDVACSLMPGVGGDSWHHLKPPDWREIMVFHQGIRRCAVLWKTVVQTVEWDIELHRIKLHRAWEQVKYEDLVRHPESIAGGLCHFLDIDPHPALIDICEKIQDDTAGSYQAAGQVAWYRDDHSRRIGRWKENIKPEDQLWINDYLDLPLRYYGYV